MKKMSEWLEEKVPVEKCWDCPCFDYAYNCYTGDADTWCNITGLKNVPKWFCIMPSFVKKLLAERTRIKTHLENKKNKRINDKYCKECPGMYFGCHRVTTCPIPKRFRKDKK